MTSNLSTSLRGKLAERRTAMKPLTVGGSPADLVEARPLTEEGDLPLLVRPRDRTTDLFSWVESSMPWVEEKLCRHGGILFRDFGLATKEDLHRFLGATGIPLMYYMEGATPRTQLGSQVYTSTEFPADQSIALHNELCYVRTWPMKIWFFCVVAPEERGETPIADMRRIYRRMDPAVRAEFEARGWMLKRNFGGGFGPTWQTSYRVETREQLEEYLRGADVSWEWLPGGKLRTTQVRPAVARHPTTGEMAWFTHVAFWHVSSLEPSLREMFLREFSAEQLPFNTYYGDGAPIPEDVIDEIRRCYEAEAVLFRWQAGDLLMLDNMLVAHGRSPFKGDRVILTAMGEPCSERGVTLEN
jgi:alpha-ketoglutarate-dependent taurine dioxygenase